MKGTGHDRDRRISTSSNPSLRRRRLPAWRNGTRRPAREARLTLERLYTTEGVHPYDEVTWERRDVVMTNWRDGSVNFEQRGVEFPDSWSVNATNIVTSKYFRGAVGSPTRESSLRQIIDRVVTTYTEAGVENGYFADRPRRGSVLRRTDLDVAAPGVLVQLAGLVQRRNHLRRSRSRPASSSPSTTRWTPS